MREAIEQLRRAGRTIVLATHNLDEADRLCDRIAFIRGGLLRIDSPARLRGALGRQGLVVELAGPATDEQLAAVRRTTEGAAAQHTSTGLRVPGTDPVGRAPGVVRTLVAGGADIVEVRPERTSLEDIYFEIMGVRPEPDGAAL